MNLPFRHKRLGYLHMNVSDIERSTKFATELFGLDFVEEQPNGARSFRAGAFHQDIILSPASTPALVRTSWAVETEAGLEGAFAHFKARGLAPRWLKDSELGLIKLERAFRVTDAALGADWEFFCDMTVIPSPRKNMLTQFEGGKHFGLCTPNCREVTEYLVKNMGFIVSDYFEGHHVSLLRAWPNPNHHSIALVQTTEPKVLMHHLAFMVKEIDDIGRLFNRTKHFGLGIQFGIGRHPTSNSIHLYIYDPDYFVWEYTLGMEQFPEQGAREARRMSPRPEDFDLWDAVPDGSHVAKLPPLQVFMEDTRPLQMA